MKVIFVIVSMAGGGAERVVSILANQFVQKGIDVTILMTAGNEIAYELDKRIQLLCAGSVSGGSMRKRMERTFNIRRVLRENPDSVIISFGLGASFFAVLADLFLHHKFIISERSDPTACPHPRLRNIIYSYAKTMVFQTEEAMKCFPVRLQKKGCVIPNPISQGIAAPYAGIRQKTVVAVGRLEAEKNYEMLLNAFQRFHAKYGDYTLHIFGQGSLRQSLEAQAEKLRLTDSVYLEGFCQDVVDRIRTAGIYVLSSVYEGVPNALLEAMAVGLPAVATDCPIGGCRFCIEDGVNGLLVPVGDEVKLAHALEWLAQHPEEANDMGKKAAGVRERFSEQAITARWVQILRGCL